MHLFGQAMADYQAGNRTHSFWVNNTNGERFAYPIERYFRSTEELSALEKRVVAEAYGKILDVGCATGYYIPALMQRGEVTGIEISKPMIELALARGLTNCFVQDVMTYQPEQLFDTVTFFEYTFGFLGSFEKQQAALEKSFSLLVPGGQILGIWETNDQAWHVGEAYFEYNGTVTQPITWLSMNQQGLADFCSSHGYICTILDQVDDEYAFRITRGLAPNLA